MKPNKNTDFATMNVKDGSIVFTNMNAEETKPLMNGRIRSDLKRKLWTSATFLNIGNAFNIAGAGLMAPLYSSLYGNGLGVAIQTVATGGGIIGSIVASLIIGKFGCRTTLLVTCCLNAISFTGNMYPTWSLLIATSILGGVASGTYTVAKRTYLGKLSQQASCKLSIDADRIHSRMFIFSVLLVKFMTIIGNLVSSLILGADSKSDDSSIELPSVKCGAGYCNEDLGSSIGYKFNGTSIGPTTSQFYSLISYCSVSLLVGICVFAYFVKDLKYLGIEDTMDTIIRQQRSTFKLLLSILSQMKDKKFLFLLPLAVSQPCGDAFWVADFSRAFVTCASGIEYIGYVAMWSGISGAISCFVFGWFNKNKYRSFPLTVATIAHLSVVIMLLKWKPGEDNLIQLSALTAFWYLGSGVKMSLVPALLGVIFSDKMEVAYSNLNLWCYIGAMVLFALSNFLCMYTKLYIMLVLLIVGFVGYIIVEIIIYYEKKGQNKMLNTCVVIKNNYLTLK